MQKAGLAPTGILANAAKTLGFASVAALLEVNPDAAAVMQAAKDAKPQASVIRCTLTLHGAQSQRQLALSMYCMCFSQ